MFWTLWQNWLMAFVEIQTIIKKGLKREPLQFTSWNTSFRVCCSLKNILSGSHLKGRKRDHQECWRQHGCHSASIIMRMGAEIVNEFWKLHKMKSNILFRVFWTMFPMHISSDFYLTLNSGMLKMETGQWSASFQQDPSSPSLLE